MKRRALYLAALGMSWACTTAAGAALLILWLGVDQLMGGSL